SSSLRSLETRWIAMIQTVPAYAAPQNEEVRRLVEHGIPSSIRYRVWEYLVNSKAALVESWYDKHLRIEQTRSSSSLNLEDDVAIFARNHQQIRPESLLNILRVYLSMVPEPQYSPNLVSIAGFTLLQCPSANHAEEEHVFWLFVTLMSRQRFFYFSDEATALVSETFELYHADLTQTLFEEYGILPAEICQPWLTSLFVDILPAEHALRVWDLFLLNGDFTILSRTAQAILAGCKRALLNADSVEVVRAILLKPPATLLPTYPEHFIDLLSDLHPGH
ncbi:rab-GTPase-TBC domain-containing protein, partial [Cristinia sonorae]